MNLLGIDFEEWFHPELIQKNISNKKKEFKVSKGIDKILDILRKHETFATFFVVGEILEQKPELLDKIVNEGHEIGFHTMYHTRLDKMDSQEKFQNELQTFSKLTSQKSKGFRAPTFSLNHSTSWAIDLLLKNDYLYDSSIIPAKTSMYGLSNAQQSPYKITSSSLEKNDVMGKLIEFPLLITRFLGKRIPAAGGFYLRTLPLKIIKNAIRSYEKKGFPAAFYIHSWEITPELMPKIQLPIKENFVTYHNLGKTPDRLEEILKIFEFTSFYRYLSEKNFQINGNDISNNVNC